jgi:hypothetical protein
MSTVPTAKTSAASAIIAMLTSSSVRSEGTGFTLGGAGTVGPGRAFIHH